MKLEARKYLHDIERAATPIEEFVAGKPLIENPKALAHMMEQADEGWTCLRGTVELWKAYVLAERSMAIRQTSRPKTSSATVQR